MPSRRSLIRGAAAVIFGSPLLAGISAATPPTDTRYQYDAGRITDAETVLTGSVSQATLRRIGLPDRATSVFAEAVSAHTSVGLADIAGLTGSLAIDGDRIVAGCVSVRGGFDRRQIHRDLEQHELSFGPIEHDEGRSPGPRDDIEAFAAEDAPYVVATDADRVWVAYGPDEAQAVTHLEASIGDRPQRPATERTTNRYDSLPTYLDGESAVYAALGPGTRRHIVDGLRRHDAPEAWLRSARAIEAIGWSLASSGDRTRTRYGFVVNRDASALQTFGETLGDISDRSSFEDLAIGRDGRTIVAETTLENDQFWGAHAAFELNSGSGKERF